MIVTYITHLKFCTSRNFQRFAASNFVFAKQFISHTNLSLPWNQTTPLGYLGETLFIIAMAENVFVTCGTITMLFLFINLHHQAFYQMFRHILSRLDDYHSADHVVTAIIKVAQLHVQAKK